MSKIYTSEVKDKIVELYSKEHKNTVEIAKMFNTYNTTIRRILIERKVPLVSIGERLRKVTLDSIKNQARIAVPDFFLPETNTIVEIKSSFTYNYQNMLDKSSQYKQLGYNFILILDHHQYRSCPNIQAKCTIDTMLKDR